MNLMQIPHSRPWITNEDIEAVADVVRSEMISTGEIVTNFQNLLLRYIGVEDGFLTRSGTEAIAIGLISIGVGHGDEVIVPTYVCRNVFDAIVEIGALPVICDTNEIGLIDHASASKRMSKKVKAIVAVHTFGYHCDIQSLQTLNVPILEDACQAFGFKFGRQLAGTYGDVGVFSFHPTKCFTSGSGGMLVSNNLEYIGRAKHIRKSGRFGFQSEQVISDMGASLGVSQLSRYPSFLERRSLIWRRYNDSLTSQLQVYKVRIDQNPVFRFVLSGKPNFEKISRYFSENGVTVRRKVDQLLHKIYDISDCDFQNSEQLFEENISIPFYPALTEEEISKICSLLSEISNVN